MMPLVICHHAGCHLTSIESLSLKSRDLWGAQSIVMLVVNLTVDSFCEVLDPVVVVVSVQVLHIDSIQELVHSTPNWLIFSLQSKFEMKASIFLKKSHHCETSKRDLTLFSSRVFPKKTTIFLRVFGSHFYLLKLLPSG